MTIREARLSDIPSIAQLRSASWETPDFWEPRVRAYMSGTHSPRFAFKERIPYVAEEKGRLTGMIAGHLTSRYECNGEVQWVDVDPGRTRQGIGTCLMRQLALWFAERRAVRICVDVRPDNLGARGFYQAHGAEVLNDHWMVWEDISVITR